MGRLFGSTIAGVLLLAGTALCAQPVPSVAPASDLTPAEAAMLARIKTFPPMDRSVEDSAAYTPAETVRGGGDKPFRTRSLARAGLSAAAVDAADAVAERHASHALLILKDGRLVHERYWNGFGPTSRFSTASMHKTVMALALGQAIGQRRLQLDDRLGQHLQEWSGDPRGDVTLRQALQMASGLALPRAGSAAVPSTMRLMFGADSWSLVSGAQQVAPAGTLFAYANSDSQIAGEALTRAIGGRYAVFLSQTLWKPMGAGDASLWLDAPGGRPHLFCCLQASARDWARVGELIRLRGKVGGRQLVPAQWIDTMAAPSPLNPNYGIQIWRGSPHVAARRYSAASPMVIPAREPFAAEDVLFLDGAGGQRVYVVPSRGLTIIRIGRPTLQWDDSELPNIVIRGLDG